jgi:hypothetical protein
MLAALGEDGPQESLENYYRFTKEKNIAGYFGVIDIENLSSTELEARKKATMMFWQQFDMLEYWLDDLSLKIDSDMAVANFHLKTRIAGNTESGMIVDQATSKAMKAILMMRNGGWKITDIGEESALNSNQDRYSLHQPFGFRPAEAPLGKPEDETKPVSDKSKI